MNKISILVKAEDQASATLKSVGNSLDGTSKALDTQSSLTQRLSANWGTFAAISAGAGVALHGLVGIMGDSVASANKLQSALLGLNSVARAFDQDAGAATEAAKTLASDGLMTVADAATGLKNLLAAGFSLDEATKLMERFKDSAAFGRQSALSFGQAVSSATEGIKNGNSILVDNAGVTKNLSMMLTDAGLSAQDLMKASSDASVRQVIFNGILKETNAQLGDAGRLAETAAGKQAQMSAQTEVLRQQIGAALQPALLSLLQTLTPIIGSTAQWISENQGLASALIIGTGIVLALVTAVGVLATGIVAARVVMATFGPTAVASFGLARAAFMGLASLIASPLALPAIAVAAALASLYQVVQAVHSVIGAINALDSAAAAKASAEVSNADAIRRIQSSNQSAEWKKRKISEITSGGRAMGGPVAQGRSYLVGENGPELFTPASGGSISSNAGTTTNITISGSINIATPQAADAFWNRIDKTQRLARVGMA